MAVCPGCGTENPETSRYCSQCGVELGVAPAREQRKTVTILFCDVSGSTALGERVDPEALRSIMTRYFETARGVIERHGVSRRGDHADERSDDMPNRLVAAVS